MNVKLWAIVLALIVVLSGTGMYLSSNAPNDDKVVITARVNEEGSGIFANKSNLVERDVNGDLVWIDGKISYDVNEWKGLVFMTPGLQTIQHVMMKEIVEVDMGLKFVDYNPDRPDTENVNFINVGPGDMLATFLGEVAGKRADGGIIWESFFSNIMDSTNTAKLVFETGERSPEHTCCVVVANRPFAESSTNSMARFLAAYIETVDWINNAMDVGGEDYAKLLSIAHNYLPAVSERVLDDAFHNVRYLYQDSPEAGQRLSAVITDVADLVEGFKSLGGILKDGRPESLGFADSTAFAQWLVDERYLELSDLIIPGNIIDWISLKVIVLNGDLHGIAAEVGKQLGIFEKYKINIELVTALNGADAMNLLVSGNAHIGLLGAPPTTIVSINMYA